MGSILDADWGSDPLPIHTPRRGRVDDALHQHRLGLVTIAGGIGGLHRCALALDEPNASEVPIIFCTIQSSA